MKRKLLGAGLLAATMFAPAQPVFAHGGNGGASSDYRIEVTGFEGDASGIEVRPVELGNRMELVRTTAREVQIVGYEGEPYIRLGADGVFENFNSPSHFTNLDRFARTVDAGNSVGRSRAELGQAQRRQAPFVGTTTERTGWIRRRCQDVRDEPGRRAGDLSRQPRRTGRRWEVPSSRSSGSRGCHRLRE